MRPERDDKHGIYSVAVVGLICFALSVGIVRAADEPSKSTTDPVSATVTVQPAEQAIAAAQPVEAKDKVSQDQETAASAPMRIDPPSLQSLQTIAFKKDMPIKDAMRMLAQMYQKNIVPSAKVEGLVTVTNLYDVTFEEALQAILGSHKYEMKGNFVRVYTNEEFKADKTRQEYVTIPLYYINAEEAAKLSKPLLSEVGAIGVTSPAKADTTPGDGGNTLAIRDYLVVSDYPEVVKKIKQVITEVDVAPPQVLIEVTVLEAVLDETTQFGINFDSLGDTVATIGQDGISQNGLASAVGTGGLTVGIVKGNFQALLRALETVTDTTILANPKILALNKQAGKLLIGKEDGYYSSENSGSDTAVSRTVEFLESGTVLEFRPFVGKDGLIRMEIRPEQSTGAISAGGLPSKSKTEVKTNIMVKDGKTIVLGGLFQEKTGHNIKQIPLLGDIPIVGQLFRSTDDNSKRTELIVLITPHIISDPEQADGADRLDDVRRLAYNARQNLTWMSRAKVDEQRYTKSVALYNEGDLDKALAELEAQEVWGIDRNYLDPLRLKERILREKQSDKQNQVERIMLGNLEREESGKWLRR
jgi:type II secretory pathway component GspD/PulD (secretin)